MYVSRMLLAIFLFGVLGTAAELLLLEHYEDVKQLIPLGLAGAGLLAGVWFGLRPGAASRAAMRIVLALFAVSGAVGLWFHYRGNVEFEREMYPELGGAQLVWQSLTGATPTLAPGAMVFLALVGYAALQLQTAARTGSGAAK